MASATIPTTKPPKPANKQFKNFCRTPVCEQTSKLFAENIDHQRNPCDDFFEYACGGFIKKNQVTGIKDMESTIMKIQNNIDRDLITKILTITNESPKPHVFVKNFFDMCRQIRKLIIVIFSHFN